MPAYRSRTTTHGMLMAALHLKIPVIFASGGRQRHELPDRSPGPLPAGQRLHAGHARRAQQLFLKAGRVIVDLAKCHYEQDDTTVHSPSMAEAMAQWDVTTTTDEAVNTFFRAAKRAVRDVIQMEASNK